MWADAFCLLEIMILRREFRSKKSILKKLVSSSWEDRKEAVMYVVVAMQTEM